MAQKQWSVEEKLEIILTAMRGDATVAELCRKHGVSDATYYKWRSRFLDGGKEALANGKRRSSNRERQLHKENEELKKALGELTAQNRLLQKLDELGH